LNSFYVSNGVDISTPRYLSITNYSPRFAFVGRLVPIKNVDKIIEAFSTVLSKFPHVTLVVVGDGPEYNDLKELVKKLGLDGNVFFSGYVDDVSRYLIDSDCLIISSDYEGLPMSVLESLNYGLGLITTDVGDCGLIANNIANGFISKDGTPSNISFLIANFIENSENYSLNAKLKNIEFAKNYYSMQSVSDKYIKLYR
jgi:glycosyltransferase involved in cell wall biosynthesis